ncbi:MAG: insulinase family protein [Deltaproteobacteria bacterium]|nr:MAG: insulinase family protein [Deltaproteobacteria bacterium]
MIDRNHAWPVPVRRTLDNGLKALCVPLEHLHTAHVLLFVRVGSRFEALDESGLSHLLEHVLFRGCAAYPSTFELNTAFEACSTGLDAATTRDFTTFEASCAPRNVPRVLELIGAMMSAPTFADVEVEKQVIAEELQDELDSKGRDVDCDNLAKLALFPGPGLGAKIGGRLRRIERFGEEDCRRWFERHYTGANMVCAVTGPVDAEATLDAIAATLGGLPRGTEQTVAPTQIRKDLPALEFVRHSGSQTDLQLAWATVDEAHPDWAALLFAQRVLDDGSCARLRHKVVDQLGLAYHAGAELEIYQGLSVLAVETQTRHSMVIRTLDALLEVLEAMATAPIDDDEFARVRNRIAFELTSVRDAPASAAYWFALQDLHVGSDSPAERAARLARVTPDEVRAAWARHIALDRVQVTVVGDLAALDRAALRRRLHRLRGAARAADAASSVKAIG